jgi:hypothetical protein
VSHRYIATKDVAELVRAYLRQNYGYGVKFSVRSDSYAGGSAVRVSHPADWTPEQSRALWSELSPWGSRGFKSHHLCPVHGVRLTGVGQHWGSLEVAEEPCCDKAEPVHMGASYVTVNQAR